MDLLEQLEARRRDLRMPMAVVAQRSKLSVPTVYRVLKQQDTSASLSVVMAIAKVLHVNVTGRIVLSAEFWIIKRAKWKAHQMASMAQGTAALEGQAVSVSEMRKLERILATKLINGPPSYLWG